MDPGEALALCKLVQAESVSFSSLQRSEAQGTAATDTRGGGPPCPSRTHHALLGGVTFSACESLLSRAWFLGRAASGQRSVKSPPQSKLFSLSQGTVRTPEALLSHFSFQC